MSWLLYILLLDDLGRVTDAMTLMTSDQEVCETIGHDTVTETPHRDVYLCVSMEQVFPTPGETG